MARHVCTFALSVHENDVVGCGKYKSPTDEGQAYGTESADEQITQSFDE